MIRLAHEATSADDIYNFSSKSGHRIFLNLSKYNYFDIGKTRIDSEIYNAVKIVTSLNPNKKITEKDIVAIDTMQESGLRLSPYTIFRPLHRDVCNRLNDNSKLGLDLREELEAVGAFEFLSRVHDLTLSKGIIERTLSVFTGCSIGATTVRDLPTDFIHTVIDFFRSTNGLGWNKEIFRECNNKTQCVANIIKGLALIFDDDRMVEKSRIHRSPTDMMSGWSCFQTSRNPLNRELVSLHARFSEDSRMNPLQLKTAVLSLRNWLTACYPGSSVVDMVSKPERNVTFSEFAMSRNGTGATSHILNLIQNARAFSVGVLEILNPTFSNIALYDLVSQKELNRVKNLVRTRPKPSRSTARPLPEKMIPIVKEILDEGETGWPGKCGYFDVNIKIGGTKQRIYCPVVPTLFRGMLEVPLRMVQLRRLDSGEGDLEQYNAETMEWEANSSSLSGYWAKTGEQPSGDVSTRGYACRIEDGVKSITGIYSNTNKTGIPYRIPWCNDKFMKIFWELRKWQEKYNPITRPISPYQYADGLDKVPKSTLEKLPDIFPIARLFENNYRPWPGRIATSSEMDVAWKYLLVELERRWNLRHPGNKVQLVKIHEKTKLPIQPRYTIHGLRVRGLTNLRRGGMPLEVLSRFVAGHATLAMTIYYLDFQPNEIAESIETALRNSTAQRDFIDSLKVAEIDDARHKTVSTSTAAITEAFTAGSQFQFCNTGLGICPYDGTRCHDGGPLRRSNGKGDPEKDVYEPVAGQNCVMCRHFISGPPWLNQLLAYGTKLCEQRQYLQHEIGGLEARYVELERELANEAISKERFENEYDALQLGIFDIKNQQEAVENAIFNVELLCNACVKILDSGLTGPGVDLVATSNSSIVQFRELTEFEQSARITAASRIHKVLGDERIEAKRNRYLDLMLANSDIIPPSLMVNLNKEHCRKAMDQFAKFVLSNISAEAIDQLVAGGIKLRDLKLEKEVRELIDVALSAPTQLPGHGQTAIKLLEANT